MRRFSRSGNAGPHRWFDLTVRSIVPPTARGAGGDPAGERDTDVREPAGGVAVEHQLGRLEVERRVRGEAAHEAGGQRELEIDREVLARDRELEDERDQERS
jgi:hypothetical protein